MVFMARLQTKMAITTTTSSTNSLTVVGKIWICLAIVMLALMQRIEAGPAPEPAPSPAPAPAPKPATASDTMLVYSPPQKRGKFNAYRPKY